MANAPVFDPTQPFEEVPEIPQAGSLPKFDPSQPFEAVAELPASRRPVFAPPPPEALVEEDVQPRRPVFSPPPPESLVEEQPRELVTRSETDAMTRPVPMTPAATPDAQAQSERFYKRQFEMAKPAKEETATGIVPAAGKAGELISKSAAETSASWNTAISAGARTAGDIAAWLSRKINPDADHEAVRYALGGGLADFTAGAADLARKSAKEVTALSKTTKGPQAVMQAEGVPKLAELVSLGPYAPFAIGVEVFGDTYQRATEAYQQSNPEWSPQDLHAHAMIVAAPSGLVSGLTWWATQFAGPKAIGKDLLTDSARSELAQFIPTYLKHIGITATAAEVDTLQQGLIAKATYNPNMPVEDIFRDAVSSGKSMAVLAALLGAPKIAALAGRDLLTRQTVREYSPEQIKDMFARVTSDWKARETARAAGQPPPEPTSNPQEEELIRGIGDLLMGSRGREVAAGIKEKGVRAVTREPRTRNETLLKLFSLSPQDFYRTVSAELVEPRKGEQDANRKQGAVAQIPGGEARPVQEMAVGVAGEIQKPAGARGRPAAEETAPAFTPPAPVVTPESAPVVKASDIAQEIGFDFDAGMTAMVPGRWHFTDRRKGSPTESLSFTIPEGATATEAHAAIQDAIGKGFTPPTAPTKKGGDSVEKEKEGQVQGPRQGLAPVKAGAVTAPPSASELSKPVVQEQVASAAMKAPDGRIFEGGTHPLAYDNARLAGYSSEGMESGFTTTLGRFVSNQEAFEIAEAAKQITRKAKPEDEFVRPELESQSYKKPTAKPATKPAAPETKPAKSETKAQEPPQAAAELRDTIGNPESFYDANKLKAAWMRRSPALAKAMKFYRADSTKSLRQLAMRRFAEMRRQMRANPNLTADLQLLNETVAALRNKLTGSPEQFDLLKVAKAPKPLEAVRNQIRRIIDNMEAGEFSTSEGWREKVLPKLEARLAEIEAQLAGKPAPKTPDQLRAERILAQATVPTLLEYAKSRLPKATADKITSETQVESYRAQWEKDYPQAKSTAPVVAPEPKPAVPPPPPTKPTEAPPVAPVEERAKVLDESNVKTDADVGAVSRTRGLGMAREFAPKVAREQKKFLLDAVDQAIEEAPDVPREKLREQFEASEEWRDIQAAKKLDSDSPELSNLVKKYFLTPIPREMKAQVEESATKAFYSKLAHIKIEVPGDGDFTIINTKDTLKDFKERAKNFPTSAPPARKPSKARIAATQPAALGKADKESTLAALAPVAGTEETRIGIYQRIWSDGERTVATNGRMLTLVRVGIGGTEKNPKVFTVDGKEVKIPKGDVSEKYPNWQQVVPSETPPNEMKDVDTARLFTILRQAQEATSEKSFSVKLWRNLDGSLGVTAYSPAIAEYSHNVQNPDVSRVIMAIDPKYLIAAINAARKVGDEKITLRWSDELAPLVVDSKNAKSVIMPMRFSASYSLEPIGKPGEGAGDEAGASPYGRRSVARGGGPELSRGESRHFPEADVLRGIRSYFARQPGLVRDPAAIQLAPFGSPGTGDAAGKSLADAARSALEASLGIEIVGLDLGVSPINGFYLPSFPGLLFVNVRSSRPVMAITGHEFLHELKRTAPALYSEVLTKLRPLFSGFEGYHRALWDLYDRKNLPLPAEGKAEEELIANLFGDSFDDSAFWARLAEKEPSLFRRLADAVLNFLRNLLTKLKRFGAYEYFTDIRQAHDVVSDALVNFARRPPGEGGMGEAGFSIEDEPPVEAAGGERKPKPNEPHIEVQGIPHFVASERMLDQEAGRQQALAKFVGAGLDAEVGGDGNIHLKDESGATFNYNAEARGLLPLARNAWVEIGKLAQVGAEPNDLMIRFLDSVRNLGLRMKDRLRQGETAAIDDRQLIEDLIQAGHQPIRQAGQMLQAVQLERKDFIVKMQHVNASFEGVLSEKYNGDLVREVLGRVFAEYRDYFTPEEIAKVTAADADLRALDEAIRQRRANQMEFGIYGGVQKRMKPKVKATLEQLERKAEGKEAIEEIIQQMIAAGAKEPPAKTIPLTPLEKLLHMAKAETVEKIDAGIAGAVRKGERNAAREVIVREKLLNEDELAAYDARTLDPTVEGYDPTPEQVTEGLKSPKFAHWAKIRDNLLGYSPVTDKLIEQVLRGEFKGVRFGKGKPKPVEVKIDLNELAKSPDAEVKRVLDAHLANIEAMLDVNGATPHVKLRIKEQIQTRVAQQLAERRKELRDPMFAEPKKAGVPLTPKQQIAKQVNAKLFADPRLDLPGMIERVAGKSVVTKLLPKMADMIARVFSAPAFRRGEYAERFGNMLADELGIDPANRDKAIAAFRRAFTDKMQAAATRAIDAAWERLNPTERSLAKTRKLWEKIRDVVNAGGLDDLGILKKIAEAHGERGADETIAEIKKLVEKEHRLRTKLAKPLLDTLNLTPEQVEEWERTGQGMTDDQIQKYTAALKTQSGYADAELSELHNRLVMLWSKLVNPIGFNSTESVQNIVRSVNEMSRENVLTRATFGFIQSIDIWIGSFINTLSSPLGHAALRHLATPVNERSAVEWLANYAEALKDALKVSRQVLGSGTAAMRLVLTTGRGQPSRIEGMSSRVHATERMEAHARELLASKDPVKRAQGAVEMLATQIHWGYRISGALDQYQAGSGRFKEMIQMVKTWLITQAPATSRLAIAKQTDEIMGDLKAEFEFHSARAPAVLASLGIPETKAELLAAAWNGVWQGVLERVRAAGLPVEQLEKAVQRQMQLLGWNLPATGYLGKIIAAPLHATEEWLAKMFIPTGAATAFGNAIVNSMELKLLRGTPLGLIGRRVLGASEWVGTPLDEQKRRAESALFMPFGLILLGVIAGGLLKYIASWPTDPKEKAKMEALGLRPGMLLVPVGDDKFVSVSTTAGPLSLISPYAAIGGKINEVLAKKARQQAKADEEAAKLGLQAEKVPGFSFADGLAAIAAGAMNSITGSRTASGKFNQWTDYGQILSSKSVASYVGAMIPFIPLWQNSAMLAGSNVDPKLAGFWDLLVPVPGSDAQRVNVLGDKVGSQQDITDKIAMLTRGTGKVVDEAELRNNTAYANIFATGFIPPAPSATKGYNFAGDYRPMSQPEMQRYVQSRGQYFKEELANLGPVDGMDPKQARQAVQQAYQRANNRALSEVGIQVESPKIGQFSAPMTVPVAQTTRLASIRPPAVRSLARGRRFGRGRSLRASIGRTRLRRSRALRLPIRSSRRPRSIRTVRMA